MSEPAEEKITDGRVYRAVRNYVQNEVLAGLAQEDRAKGWKDWLRRQVIEASRDAFKGFSREKWVEQCIRNEVGAVFNTWSKEGALRGKIEEIIRQEVQKIIKDRMEVTATLKLDHQPPRYEEKAEF